MTAASAQSSQGHRSPKLLAAGTGRAARPSTIRSRTRSCPSSSPRSRQAAKTSKEFSNVSEWQRRQTGEHRSQRPSEKGQAGGRAPLPIQER